MKDKIKELGRYFGTNPFYQLRIFWYYIFHHVYEDLVLKELLYVVLVTFLHFSSVFLLTEFDFRWVCQWRCSGVFIFNFEHISHFVLLFLLLTLSR